MHPCLGCFCCTLPLSGQLNSSEYLPDLVNYIRNHPYCMTDFPFFFVHLAALLSLNPYLKNYVEISFPG
jgi:hypothetical protein